MSKRFDRSKCTNYVKECIVFGEKRKGFCIVHNMSCYENCYIALANENLLLEKENEQIKQENEELKALNKANADSYIKYQTEWIAKNKKLEQTLETIKNENLKEIYQLIVKNNVEDNIVFQMVDIETNKSKQLERKLKRIKKYCTPVNTALKCMEEILQIIEKEEKDGSKI